MLESASCSVYVAFEKTATTNKCFDGEDREEMTIIPQAYWDDLLESAFSSVNAIPVDL